MLRKDHDWFLFVCICVCTHNCFQLCVCVYALLMHYIDCSGLLLWIADFLARETESPPCRAESYVSETLTLFQAIIFPFFLSFWLSHPSLLLALTSSCPSFLSDECSFQLLSSHHLSHLSSFYSCLCFSFFFSPLLAICWTSAAGCIFFTLSSLFSLSPHSLLQMSDQTEQHDSQRRAEFPLVHHSISNRTVCCV